MKTIKPIYKGPKRNHAAVFIGEGPYPRIRFLYSNGTATYCHCGDYGAILESQSPYGHDPCYFNEAFPYAENIKRMKAYDLKCENKTIFLGYVKDTE